MNRTIFLGVQQVVPWAGSGRTQEPWLRGKTAWVWMLLLSFLATTSSDSFHVSWPSLLHL